ncbi:hypothetical protein CRYUN_Cryun25bG0065600 [Craigia yunnanensis]
MGFTSILLGDALRVINQINLSSPDLSKVGNLVDKCRSLVRIFQSCSVSHVNRSANAMAHSLAKLALETNNDLYWIEDFPPVVLAIVAKDCNPQLS